MSYLTKMATKKILIAGVGGLARSPTDCKDSSLDLLDGPPMFVSALKGKFFKDKGSSQTNKIQNGIFT